MSGHIASRKQQNNSLCRAVNPPPFDKGGNFRARRGIVRFERVSVGQSLSLATDKAERILNILESQSKTIYDRSSFVAIQLPLLKGAKNAVQDEGIVRFWEGRCGGVTIH